MYSFPKDLTKIKERIRRYERALKNEQKRFGDIDDGAGKRYLLGPLYLLAGDIKGALAHYRWFSRTCPDDSGEPIHALCWTLALHLGGEEPAAKDKLRQTMLMNLYLIPRLLGENPRPLDIWHGSNLDLKEYADDVPPEIYDLWDVPAKEWLESIYRSREFEQVRRRYIEIHRQLKDERPGPKRTQLVMEAHQLRNPDAMSVIDELDALFRSVQQSRGG